MRIIGICGISGSGKSYLLQRIKELAPSKISILSTDDYYKSRECQQKDKNGIENFDLPSSINVEQLIADINSLRKGDSVSITKYTFNLIEAKPKIEVVEPSEILLVEGIFVLAIEELKAQFHNTIFIKSDLNTVLEKRVLRDVAERGMSEEEVLYQWENHVLPGYKEHVLPYEKNVNSLVYNDHKTDTFVEEIYRELGKNLLT